MVSSYRAIKLVSLTSALHITQDNTAAALCYHLIRVRDYQVHGNIENQCK